MVEALAMPIAAHAALSITGAKELKILTYREFKISSFMDFGEAFKDCHDHNDGIPVRGSDYSVDIKPLSFRLIVRYIAGGMFNVAEHLGLMNAETMLALALIAIWFPYGIFPINLNFPGLANPLAALGWLLMAPINLAIWAAKMWWKVTVLIF